MKNKLSKLLNVFFVFKPYWKYGKIFCVISILLYGVILPINSIASVLFTQSVIDAVAVGATFYEVMNIIIIFLFILLFTLLCQNAYDILYSEKKHIEIQQKINLEIYNKVIKTDYQYFDNPEFYNNYTWALNEYAVKSKEAFMLICNTVCSFSTIFSMVAVILLVGPLLIVITIMELLITVFFETRRNKLIVDRQELMIPNQRKMDYVHRIFYQRDYVEDLKVTNIKHHLIDMYNNARESKVSVIRQYCGKILAWLYAQNFMAIFYNACVMAYISYGLLVSKKIIGVGKFMSLITANSQLMTSLYSFFSLIAQMNSLDLYANRIKVYFETDSKIEGNCLGKEIIQQKPFSVNIKNLNYSYNNSKFALKDINLEIKEGEKIAIVGENGAGKTTLVKLLLRLYEPDEGDIYYNGCKINDYNVEKLRKKIGIAFQKTNIYALSFADNFKLYKDFDIEELNSIINNLELNEVLDKFAADIDVEMTKEFNPDGIVLSLGETQKVGIGRIMSHEFGLLILDEPSASLDPLAEYKLSNILYNEANKTTTILIAHRLSMVRAADKIIVMNKGQIFEMGKHDELMQKKGIYYEMFSKQAEKYN